VTTLETVQAQLAAVKSLTGKGVKDIEILGPEAARPAGCVLSPIGSSAAVFLHVKGQVDMDAEIEKARKKLEKARSTIEKQNKILADPGYKAKVAADVQEADRKRIVDLESEAKGFEGTIKQFEQLKLE
jgi:valyl-tRNA synthetase